MSNLTESSFSLVAGWKDDLVTCLAAIEAELDFGDEADVSHGQAEVMRPEMARICSEIEQELRGYPLNERRRRGLVAVVTGAPNVGKSSLVNALARREVAIVTEIAGTTRDVLEVSIDLDGLALTLVDTAGIHEVNDPIEREGIRRARMSRDSADILIEVSDRPTFSNEHSPAGRIRVLSKADLAQSEALGVLPSDVLAVSVVDGRGLDTLAKALLRESSHLVSSGTAGILAHERQAHAARAAVAALRPLLFDEMALDMKAEQMRLAVRAFDRLTGTTTSEEVLDRIFSRFCIGK